ncbi:aminotransferase class V-fold PLP-dependent enzyme [candidate division KSB1 bacterium]
MQRDYSKDFGSFNRRIWLNCAHQGPMPKVSGNAVFEALNWKISPHLLEDELFYSVPERLKSVLGRLINVPPEEIILSNSTSYGLHLLANGIPFKAGDEILLVDGDFPANILPWIALREKGVNVRLFKLEGAVPEPEEVEKQIKPETRLFCTSWVNSFTGHAADIQKTGELCRENGVFFVLNGSQALGARSLNIQDTPVDAFTCCGFKWLCGPYGTGFSWLSPELLGSLEYNQAYWLTVQRGKPLNRMRDYRIGDNLGAAKYDVFGTANFFNFLPWTESIEYLLKFGIEQIEKYDNQLVSQFVGGLDREKYSLISPENEDERSTIIVLSHKESSRNTGIFELLKREEIDISLRENNLRISPHLYNTAEEISELLRVLNSVK